MRARALASLAALREDVVPVTIGREAGGGITSWWPLFLFVVLFGLSMDYHVFILSRIREAVLAGASTEAAVAHGIKSTAGVVTSAAAVMIAVFSVFATLGAIEFKRMGVGLGAAVLIDATIVRAVLLPATLRLLGDWTGTCRAACHGCRRPVRSRRSRPESTVESDGARPIRADIRMSVLSRRSCATCARRLRA